jgi:hypothetical protein
MAYFDGRCQKAAGGQRMELVEVTTTERLLIGFI